MLICCIICWERVSAESAVSPAILEQLCTPEHEFIGVAAWYKQKDVGGQLNVPGIADINGYLADASLVLASMQEDENVGYLVEATLWSKGLSRIDARIVSLHHPHRFRLKE